MENQVLEQINQITAERSEMELYGQFIMHLWIVLNKIDLLPVQVFERKVKFRGNQFKESLENHPYFNKLLNAGYKSDRYAFDNISTHTEHIIEYISKLQLHRFGTDDMTILSITARKIIENRQFVVERLGIPIGAGEDLSHLEDKVRVNNLVNSMDKLQFERLVKYIDNVLMVNN